nr:DUF4232 domain-containing protein [Kribbella sandramycini]
MAWVGLALILSACGTERATGGESAVVPTPKIIGTPTPVKRTPTRPPATCPASGRSIQVSEVEPALGHRSVAVTLTNCRADDMAVEGYPEIVVLDGERRPMKITVSRGSSYLATDPGPGKIRLKQGKSVEAFVSWSNTTTDGEVRNATFLSIARGKQEGPVVWPVELDLGTTGAVKLTAWHQRTRS